MKVRPLAYSGRQRTQPFLVTVMFSMRLGGGCGLAPSPEPCRPDSFRATQPFWSIRRRVKVCLRTDIDRRSSHTAKQHRPSMVVNLHGQVSRPRSWRRMPVLRVGHGQGVNL